MKQIGKIGKINRAATRKILRIFADKDIRYCEGNIPGICNGLFTAPAHRHSRIWYRSKLELLSAFKQILLLCQACHAFIDHPINKNFKEEIFLKLRGPE